MWVAERELGCGLRNDLGVGWKIYWGMKKSTHDAEETNSVIFKGKLNFRELSRKFPKIIIVIWFAASTS